MRGLFVIAKEDGFDGFDSGERRKAGQGDCPKALGRGAGEGVCNLDIAVVDIVIFMVVMFMAVRMVVVFVRLFRRETFRQGYLDRG